jgi:hypothetical protein
VTRAFDQSARAYLDGSLWGAPEGSGTVRPKDIRVRRVSVKSARPFVASYHYSRTMPDATREVFAGYFPGSVLAGFVVFGMGAGKNQYTRLLPDLADGEYRELSRLWSPDGMPTNTESRLISAAIRQLIGVRLVISYADPSQGHNGAIYQATNFVYLGQTDGGERLVDESGQEVHSKLLSVYRMRHPRMADWPSKDIAEHFGFRPIPNPSKHRYAYAIRPEDRAVLAAMAQPYPRAVAASSDAPDDQSGEGGSQPTLPLHPLDDGRDDSAVVSGHREAEVVEPTPDAFPGHDMSLIGPSEGERLTLSGQSTDFGSDGERAASVDKAHIRHSGDGSGVPCRAHRPATARVTA